MKHYQVALEVNKMGKEVQRSGLRFDGEWLDPPKEPIELIAVDGVKSLASPLPSEMLAMAQAQATSEPESGNPVKGDYPLRRRKVTIDDVQVLASATHDKGRQGKQGRPKKSKPSEDVALHREFIGLETDLDCLRFAQEHGFLIGMPKRFSLTEQGWLDSSAYIFAGNVYERFTDEELRQFGEDGVAVPEPSDLIYRVIEPIEFWMHHRIRMQFIFEVLEAERFRVSDDRFWQICQRYEISRGTGDPSSNIVWIRGNRCAAPLDFMWPMLPRSRDAVVDLACGMANEVVEQGTVVKVSNTPLSLKLICTTLLAFMYANLLQEAFGLFGKLTCCPNCHRWFEQDDRAKKYCSRSCVVISSRARRRASEQENLNA